MGSRSRRGQLMVGGPQKRMKPATILGLARVAGLQVKVDQAFRCLPARYTKVQGTLFCRS